MLPQLTLRERPMRVALVKVMFDRVFGACSVVDGITWSNSQPALHFKPVAQERPAVHRSKDIKLQEYLATSGVNNVRYGGAGGFAKCWDDNPEWAAKQEALGRSQTWMTDYLPDTYQPIPSDFEAETKRLDALRFVEVGAPATWAVPCVDTYGCLMPFRS